MKKRIVLIVSVVLFLIIVLIAPWATGKMLDQKLKTFVSRLNTLSSEKGFKFSLEKVASLGWFNSKARIRVKRGADTWFVEDLTLKHGPVVLPKKGLGVQFLLGKIEGSLRIDNPALKSMLPQFVGQQVLMMSETDVHFFGDMDTKILSHNFNVAYKQYNLKWGGFSGRFRNNANYDAVDFTFKLQPVSYNDWKHSVQVGKLTKQVVLHETPLQFWVGEVDSHLDSLDIKGKNPDVDFVLRDLNFNGSVLFDGKNNVNQEIKFDVSTLLYNKKSYAPSHFVFSLKNVNAEGWAKLRQLMLQETLMQPLSPGEVMPVMLKLVHENTAIAVDSLDFTVPQGKVLFSAKIFWPEKGVYQNSMSLLMGMHSIVKLRVPVKFVELMLDEFDKSDDSQLSSAPTDEQALSSAGYMRKTLASWEEQGFVTRKNDFYETIITSEGMSVKVNGKVLGS